MMWRRKKNKGIAESEKALAEARQRLEQTKKRAVEVDLETEKSRRFRQKNHFAEQFASIMGGSP